MKHLDVDANTVYDTSDMLKIEDNLYQSFDKRYWMIEDARLVEIDERTFKSVLFQTNEAVYTALFRPKYVKWAENEKEDLLKMMTVKGL